MIYLDHEYCFTVIIKSQKKSLYDSLENKFENEDSLEVINDFKAFITAFNEKVFDLIIQLSIHFCIKDGLSTEKTISSVLLSIDGLPLEIRINQHYRGLEITCPQIFKLFILMFSWNFTNYNKIKIKCHHNLT